MIIYCVKLYRDVYKMKYLVNKGRIVINNMGCSVDHGSPGVGHRWRGSGSEC
jgi:hypothetical protein